MPAHPAGPDRPRVVDFAFGCWLAGAVLVAALGLLTLTQGGHPTIVGLGVLLVAVGLAQGYLAGRTRRRHVRFANAAVGLALAAVVFLALVLLLFGGGIIDVVLIAVTMACLIAGCVLIRRTAAQQWLGGAA
ncbi:hypothetical protein [Mycolicibacterium grossiae]|uniref:Uncharacterized protein n=1 Tax=Mycolicibacterium grossiae TaxID=1552759 RepID=A0A1E8Q2K1_9MYCO|nr:hypothetical protein [Mycolicibacterium grossiae]OFJ52715.1 hypothetical protein BEL07_15870 [Mycolicibacterium grossiae]QEM45024.1 hypothetical protein FZ046_09735 [Mycolicibacterium grossiae]